MNSIVFKWVMSLLIVGFAGYLRAQVPGNSEILEGYLMVVGDETSISDSDCIPQSWEHLFFTQNRCPILDTLPQYSCIFEDELKEINVPFIIQSDNGPYSWNKKGNSSYEISDSSISNRIFHLNVYHKNYQFRSNLRAQGDYRRLINAYVHVYRVRIDVIFIEDKIYENCYLERITIPQYVLRLNTAVDEITYLYKVEYPYFLELPRGDK